MPVLGTLLTVLISGPGDVAASKEVIRNAVLRWNELNSIRQKVALVPLMYERDATPRMGARAQTLINEQIVDDCDIAVAAFWTRLGTPTGVAPSGTAEEITRCVAAAKPVTVYFQKAPVDPELFDHTEFERLKSYREQCKSDGLLDFYASADELTDKLLRHLTSHVELVMRRYEGNALMVRGEVQPERRPSDDQEKDAVEARRVENERFGKALRKLRGGKYPEGLSEFVEAMSDSTKPDDVVETQALARLLSSEAGSDAAFDDLETQAREHPGNAAVQRFHAEALANREQYSQALSVVDAALQLPSLSDDTQAALAIVKASIVSRSDGVAAGRAILKAAARAARGRASRARVFSALASEYAANAGPADALRHVAFQELVLENQVADTQARFDLAYEYANKLDNHSMALYHYQRLLTNEPEHGAGQNNAGWAASELGLRLTSGRYFARAADLKEPVAFSNLGGLYLEAGLEEDVRAVLRTAREAGVEHPNLDRLGARLVEAVEDDGRKLKDITDRAEQRRSDLVLFGKALIAPDLVAAELAGEYDGSPIGLRLEGSSEGAVSGTFEHTPGVTATLSGTIDGHLLTFEWREAVSQPAVSEPPERGLSGLLIVRPAPRVTTGHGVIRFDAGRAVGYYAKGPLKWELGDADARWVVDAQRRAVRDEPKPALK